MLELKVTLDPLLTLAGLVFVALQMRDGNKHRGFAAGYRAE